MDKRIRYTQQVGNTTRRRRHRPVRQRNVENEKARAGNDAVRDCDPHIPGRYLKTTFLSTMLPFMFTPYSNITYINPVGGGLPCIFSSLSTTE